MFGGGFTFGNPNILAVSVMAQHQVDFTATLPSAFSSHGKGFSAYKGLKWALVEWYNAKNKIDPTARLVKLHDNKIDDLVKLKENHEKHLLQNYDLTDKAKKETGMTMAEMTNALINRDNIDAIVNFATEFEYFLKNTPPANEDDYVIGIQRAYWASHVNHACAKTNVATQFIKAGEPMGDTSCDGKKCLPTNCHFTNSPSVGFIGMGGTKGPPDCTDIHKFLGVKLPGYFNLLCSFMTSASLIEGRAKPSGWTEYSKGVKGMKNMLDMIPIIMGKALTGEKQASVGLFPQKDGRLDLDTIKNKENDNLTWLQDLELGKWDYVSSSKIMLRALGNVFSTDSSKLRDDLKTLMDNKQPDSDAACEANARPADCGIAKYKVMTTFALTAGFGGSINFCTPDTNGIQLYRGFHREYQTDQRGGTWDMVEQEWTHKVTFAGQIYFNVDISRAMDSTTTKFWEAKLRITVPFTFKIHDTQDTSDLMGGRSAMPTCQ